jgi:uncharacterized low-complexity protein
MSKHILKKSHVLATAVAASSFTLMANASQPTSAADLFSATELPSGYKVAMGEGKCGEGKCGAKDKTKEGKCGEGKCGEGKCGAKDESKEGKTKEGKCGEGKCGEGKCGSETKSTEGKCGEGKCGGKN